MSRLAKKVKRVLYDTCFPQLEVNIGDMEKTNSRLAEESTTDKARIKW